MVLNSRKRHLAVQRALKMNMLFKENVMDPIVAALDMASGTPAQKTARKNAFYAALAAIPNDPLVQAEKDWLWNYLQHCNELGFGGWRAVPEAASSSW